MIRRVAFFLTLLVLLLPLSAVGCNQDVPKSSPKEGGPKPLGAPGGPPSSQPKTAPQ
jgi:hypothetical protein